MKYVKIFISFILLLLLISCNQSESFLAKKENKPKLLVFCGVTMKCAIKKIADIFEKKENIEVYIITDSSGFLLKSILLNKKGDIFYPGKIDYINKLRDENLILSSRYVGYNQAVFMVQKGNPKKIKPKLSELMRSDISIAIGSSDYSSIGKETEKILRNAGLYNFVKKNITYIAPNSKSLIEAIKSKEVDLAINWRAVAYSAENKGKVDILRLPANIAKPNYLIMSSLVFSKNVELAEKFLNFAASYDAQKILIDYGLND